MKKSTSKKAEDSAKILGVRLDSTSLEEVLKKAASRLRSRQKTLIFTPNPEFLVLAQEKPAFKRFLNQAQINVPDGVGLILASRFLGQPLKKGRVAGADVAAALLEKAAQNHWRVGIVGARRGVVKERRQLIKKLRQQFSGAEIFALEEMAGWQKQSWQLIFACQGMGKQEKWLVEEGRSLRFGILMGVGGGLDFLTGFARRAPLFIRKIGFEWLYRLLIQPWRWRRQLNLIKFIGLIFKERLQSWGKFVKL